ncbi:MAG: hypothetical protein KatS3mg031_1009 [Chitinophagales bacterium]|nr:MAG: hypothetical protein KatS3mg031_1009 [Chitinophagales bacterium]
MTAVSRKKVHFTVTRLLRHYLAEYDRESRLPVTYNDLLRYSETIPHRDKNGNETLWETVMYDHGMAAELNAGLAMIYSILKNDGDTSVLEHLYVSRIDYCTFGNSNPFRVRIVNMFNDNYDYFYVKKADASRIYGLELEHILSPNRINYLVDKDTLIEEHIPGIPGNDFIRHYIHKTEANKVRIAKEFVKFNERCFVRLLGDMRSYNYVVDVTPDFEDEQYRIRPIDFDQQSYEGKKTMYLPQFFKENNPIVKMCMELMTPETYRQYQNEERTLVSHRMKAERTRIRDLLNCMKKDTLSRPEKIAQLRSELARHHKEPSFEKCQTMGEIVEHQLKVMLANR